jgi:hypothetical protein
MSLTVGLGLPLVIMDELSDANGRSGRDEGKAGPRLGWLCCGMPASGESRRAKALDSGDETLGWYCTDSAANGVSAHTALKLGAQLKPRPTNNMSVYVRIEKDSRIVRLMLVENTGGGVYRAIKKGGGTRTDSSGELFRKWLNLRAMILGCACH